MGIFLHPIRRIVMLIRDNLAQMRQPDRRQAGGSSRAAKKDPTLTKIVAEFSRFDIEKSRGGYLVFKRGSSDTIARLRPIPDTDSSYFICPTSMAAGARSAISAA
jgi:hypothetical protein